MIKTSMKIDGMMCGMCEAHVCDATQRRSPLPEVKKKPLSWPKRPWMPTV